MNKLLDFIPFIKNLSDYFNRKSIERSGRNEVYNNIYEARDAARRKMRNDLDKWRNDGRL